MGRSEAITPPPNILLATDLEAHSDRALDRAAQLARQWHAKLHVVHVLPAEVPGGGWASEGDGSPEHYDELKWLERRIRADLQEEPDELVVHIARGIEPADLILGTAEQQNCGLVIAGTSSRLFADVAGRSTTARLLRLSTRPVLVVKSRPHGAYRKILVGTDFTPESRCGLETAAAWFDDAHFTLIHALDIPYRSLLLESDRGQVFAELEREAMQTFLDTTRISDEIRRHLYTHIEYGLPQIVLRRHALTSDIDLTVIGALKRGLAFRVLVGGHAARIVESARSDVLMVRTKEIGAT